MATRADLHAAYSDARTAGDEEACEEIRDTVTGIDQELRALGVRGRLDPGPQTVRRSTRRRQDAPNLPRRPVEGRTIGRVFGGK